jgi:hypothetical protein
MNDLSGWLWVLLAVLGIGGLGLGIAYGSTLWGQRRKDWIMKQQQENAVRDNYQQEEIREKRRDH